MHITTPQFGGYRPQSFSSAPVNLRSPSTNAAPSPANVAATNAVSPSTGAASTFDADTVSKNILSFVQQRLTQAAQQGASKDRLASLLEQARKGASAGFDQAVKQLQGSGSLDDTLSSGISSALQKVDTGFDALAKQFGLAGGTDSAASNPVASSTATASTSTLSQLAASYSASFSSKQSVDLIVKTADGDTVHLQLGIKNKQSVSASYQAGAAGQQLSISSSQKSSAGLSISVDGNLDAGELQALSDLLGKVGDLADKFFSGDLAGALQQAHSLDFSNPELSSLSLNLHSEERISQKVAAYQQIQGLSGDGTGNNAAAPSLANLSSLADALSSLLPQASTSAANPASLLKQLLAAHVGANDRQNNPLLSFANRLLTALGADTASAIDSATIAPSSKASAGAAATVS